MDLVQELLLNILPNQIRHPAHLNATVAFMILNRLCFLTSSVRDILRERGGRAKDKVAGSKKIAAKRDKGVRTMTKETKAQDLNQENTSRQKLEIGES
jgi:hypothetical protein